MLSSSEKIEKQFEKYFQKTIELSVNGEMFKRGKFLLITNNIIHNNYYFEFIIERVKKIDSIKVPYPFLLEEHEEDGIIYFDYRIKNLINEQSTGTMNKILTTFNISPSKFFNNILEIKFE